MLANFDYKETVESSKTRRKKLSSLILIEKIDTKENMKGIKNGIAAKENVEMPGEETKCKGSK